MVLAATSHLGVSPGRGRGKRKRRGAGRGGGRGHLWPSVALTQLTPQTLKKAGTHAAPCRILDRVREYRHWGHLFLVFWFSFFFSLFFSFTAPSRQLSLTYRSCKPHSVSSLSPRPLGPTSCPSACHTITSVPLCLSVCPSADVFLPLSFPFSIVLLAHQKNPGKR